jgi:hypothetical protein
VKYLLSFYQPTGGEPDPELLERVMADLGAVNDDLQAAGKWVFGGGLHAPDTATVLRLKGDDVAATDGPFSEGKEHLGGITIIEADDLDEALAWAGRIARATTLPIEVRPFQH